MSIGPTPDIAQLEHVGQVLADTPWPGSAAEPMFAQPWEGRAFGLAFDVVRRSGLDWEDFRSRLIVALAEVPERPYYESWVVALERLTTERIAVPPSMLAAARDEASWYRYDDPVLGEIEVSPFRAARFRALTVGVAVALPATAVEQASQIELYRTIEATPRGGVRAFDGRGSSLADIQLLPPEWDALRRRLLGPTRI